MMRRTPRTGPARGFTLIEIVIALGVASTVLASTLPFLATSNGLIKEVRLDLRAECEQRRNLQAIGRALQGIALATLEGVDPVLGVAKEPSFCRVTGVKAGVPTLAPAETIVWRASPRPVPGVKAPGELWLVGGPSESLLATRVPQGGFVLAQEGRSLRITLTTYYPIADRVESVTSSTTVATRN